MSGTRRESESSGVYRGRVAPSPTGYLHLGHARTFYTAFERARGGTLIYRDEDLDRARCRPEFAEAALQDLRQLGIFWQEGPDCGGPNAPYRQSERLALYRNFWKRLHASGLIYPCRKSRAEIARAAGSASGAADSEPIFPAEFRPPPGTGSEATEPGVVNWRFRVPDDEMIHFRDLRLGATQYTAGLDFGDFLVWRKDGWPSYELAVVVDDILMQVTEVVRGADLLLSTARQLLVYRALQARSPDFYHCELVCDESGRRLAKRHDALALRTLFERGMGPQEILELSGWTDRSEELRLSD